MANNKEKTQGKDLYTIKVKLTGDRKIDIFIESSDEVDAVATMFPKYEEVEATFFKDIADSVKLFAQAVASLH